MKPTLQNAVLVLFLIIAVSSEEFTSKDKKVCAELETEYRRTCKDRHLSGRNDEFCKAFVHICRELKSEDDEQTTAPPAMASDLVPMSAPDKKSNEMQYSQLDNATPIRSPSSSHKSLLNMANFCVEFKSRYLFVCPDPFRFGQKALLFCPIYSERCNVPLPDHPVSPTPKPPKKSSAIAKICRSYRAFAANYCNNAFVLSQTQYRESCERYRRYCGSRY